MGGCCERTLTGEDIKMDNHKYKNRINRADPCRNTYRMSGRTSDAKTISNDMEKTKSWKTYCVDSNLFQYDPELYYGFPEEKTEYKSRKALNIKDKYSDKAKSKMFLSKRK
ncbi:unnamed protein product [Moneuplotes crassus]|uniref:Uncharacterized protein n=1 Tax=Euplotes crassus TaxID=5936 RepID=A0AAD1X7C9_EUPCR|nr:unnamed protein product [Moneuplotes crassus]